MDEKYPCWSATHGATAAMNLNRPLRWLRLKAAQGQPELLFNRGACNRPAPADAPARQNP